MRRRYHLHPPGLLYLLLVVVLGIAAANRPGNLLVWVFAAMLAGVLVSGILSGPTLMRLSAVRLLPRTARAGEPLVVGYAVSQRSRLWPAFALHVREREAPPGSRAFVQHVGAGETVVAEAVFWPERRGRMVLPSFRLETSFPFGLIRKSIRFDERGSSATESSSFPEIESGIHAEKMRSLAKDRICTSCVHTFERSSPTIGEKGSNPAPGA
ncbi:MAG: hypothetical protein ACKOJI_10975, partial [Phycisphaerales bacterium]